MWVSTVHGLLTGLSKVRKRTYQRLTEVMKQYDFEMISKKGDCWPGMMGSLRPKKGSCSATFGPGWMQTSSNATSAMSADAKCTEPQQRIHPDLFGPLRTTIRDKMYILSMTEAFTKYVELVFIPSKEAGTIAKAIFDR